MRTQHIVRGLIAMGLLAGILQTGPAKAAPQGGVTWTSFQDPNEQAFTMEVPKGWTIKGGLFRVGYSDARYMVDMISPDGKTEVRLGDMAIPPYARTSLTSNIWTVSMLASFLAPTEAVPQARNILLHCTQAFHLNPPWIQKQQQEDAYGLEYQKARQQQRMAALGQQVQQFERQMQAMRDQVSSFERGQERQAAQVNSFDQALRGVTPTVDPYGNEREVWTGPYANCWRNGNGSVVNSTQSPGAGWTQLKPEQ